MTAQDYQKLYEEGFKPEDLTIEALSEAIQVIKEYFEGALSRTQMHIVRMSIQKHKYNE